MYCPKCGTQNPDDARFCSSCGSPMGVSSGTPGENSVSTSTTSIPLDPEKATTFIVKNVDYYAQKYNLMNTKHSKISWNWASCLFSTCWLFYRKMYAAGAILIAIGLVSSWIGGILSMIVTLGTFIAMGLLGNYLYLNHVSDCLLESQNMNEQEWIIYATKKGGTSVGAVFIPIGISLVWGLAVTMIKAAAFTSFLF